MKEIFTSTYIKGISENIDKQNSGYKRRFEALQTAPEQFLVCIERALFFDGEASYLSMDSWFTQQPLIKSIVDQALDVIGW